MIGPLMTHEFGLPNNATADFTNCGTKLAGLFCLLLMTTSMA